MRLNLNTATLQQMTDGVVGLDRYGKVLQANPAGRPWMALCRQRSDVYKRLIDEERSGRLTMPTPVNFGATKAWICKNGRNEYAVYVIGSAGTPDATPPPPALDSGGYFVKLMGTQVREELNNLRGALEKVTAADQAQSASDLGTRSDLVVHLLKEMTQLSELTELDNTFASERISLSELVESLLAEIPVSQTNQVFAYMHTNKYAAPVYGHKEWLAYALRLLIRSVMAGAPKKSQVELVLRQQGDYVVLASRVVGAGHTPVRALGSAAGKAPDKTENADANVDGRVRWLMCRRIIEIHDGHLKSSYFSAEAGEVLPSTPLLESFTLTLPTGVPARARSRPDCTDCVHVLQEQAYAKDLAKLLARPDHLPT